MAEFETGAARSTEFTSIVDRAVNERAHAGEEVAEASAVGEFLDQFDRAMRRRGAAPGPGPGHERLEPVGEVIVPRRRGAGPIRPAAPPAPAGCLAPVASASHDRGRARRRGRKSRQGWRRRQDRAAKASRRSRSPQCRDRPVHHSRPAGIASAGRSASGAHRPRQYRRPATCRAATIKTRKCLQSPTRKGILTLPLPPGISS